MKKTWISILMVSILLFISACGEEDTQVSENNDTNEEVSTEVRTVETEYPYTVTDITGTEITIEEEPERIVSISTSDTEILFALGLDEEIVGVTDFDNYPEEALDKPKIGGVVDPNVEAILTQEPDLIVTGNSIGEDVLERIRSLDLTVYQTDPKTMEETLEVIMETGIITNRQAEAEELVAEMQEVIDGVTEVVGDIPEEEKKLVYIEYNPGWTVGAGEYMNELIELAGGINVVDEPGWVQVSEEKIIQDDPDVIIYAADLVDSDSGKQLGELIKERSGWDKITAIQEDQMVPVDMNLMSRNGPRLVEALQQFAEGIYPELFEQ